MTDHDDTIFPDDARVDGRILRGQRNRERLIDSFVALMRGAQTPPRAQDIADHAGLSVRTLFQHFADLDALRSAAALHLKDRLVGWMVEYRTRLESASDLERRLRTFAEMRRVMWEEVMPLYPLVVSSFLADGLITDAVQSIIISNRDMIDEFLASGLHAESGNRPIVLSALRTTLSMGVYENLRHAQGLDPETAEKVIFCMARAVLFEKSGPSES